MATTSRDKKADFTRLAQRRTTTALKSIQVLGNLANTNNYDYDSRQVDKIVKALEAEVAKLKDRFAGRAEGGFTL
jgi:hypothetical protein